MRNMTRQEMIDLVRGKATIYVDDFDPAMFQETSTLQNSGLDSLAIVEIVAAVVKELNIKIPRTELGQVKTIGNLIDVLLNQVNQCK